MSKWICAVGGLVLLATPGISAAEDKLDSRLQAMMACGSLTPDDVRLRCYDQAMLNLKQAVDQGALVLEEKKGPKGLGGVVRASGVRSDNVYWIELENGDRWKLLPTTVRRGAPQVGTTIKLRKGLLTDGYRASGDGWSESKAEFLGHGS